MKEVPMRDEPICVDVDLGLQNCDFPISVQCVKRFETVRPEESVQIFDVDCEILRVPSDTGGNVEHEEFLRRVPLDIFEQRVMEAV
jgi:hypothetical protein